MIDLRPVLFIVGILLTALGAFMLVPAMVDAALGGDEWRTFVETAAITLFVALSLTLATRSRSLRLDVRQTFLLTTLAWVAMAAFAALPFVVARIGLDYADAFFEAMSGLTTTGSTVIVGLDGLSPGILLWRALLQWQGGIGIIVMAIAVLPALRVGGMQLFRTESSEQAEKALPRAAQISAVIGGLYVALTIACAIAYGLAGMGAFEAVAHAMTTIATAGYATHDASIGHFESAAIEWVATGFMVIGSLPFILYFEAVRGRPGALWRDSQVQAFLGFLLFAVLVIAYWLWLTASLAPDAALRLAAFNTVSMITGTGYASADFNAWGGFAVTVILFAMAVGGCTGSTTGGVKMFRFQVLHAAVGVQIRRLLQPHGVFSARYNRRPLPREAIDSVMAFFLLFVVSFFAVALALALMGLDLTTAVSGALTALANVGPGLGDVIGPAGSFAPLPDGAKWLLAAAMLVGRLELFTVLVLLTPRFWRG